MRDTGAQTHRWAETSPALEIDTGIPAVTKLQEALVTFPLGVEPGHQCSETWMGSEMIEIGITGKQRVTWEAIIGCRLEPLHGRLGLLHYRISAGNVIGSMVKVSETFPFLYRTPDLLFRLFLVTREGCDQRLDAGE